MRPSQPAWYVAEALPVAFQVQLLRPKYGHLFTPSFQLQSSERRYRSIEGLGPLPIIAGSTISQSSQIPTSAPVLHHVIDR